MKIICIGRNYAKHAKELNNLIPEEPVVFLKPETALLLKKHPFFIPGYSNEVHHELELVIKINRLGKHIEPRFAHKYYSEVGLGIDFTARDVQTKCKKIGLPGKKPKPLTARQPFPNFSLWNLWVRTFKTSTSTLISMVRRSNKVIQIICYSL